ncbi:Transcription factor bHLH25, partial [Mucuna pruriens]
MEQSWENWALEMEMEDDDRDLLEGCDCHTEEEEFLREILNQPAFSSESESQPFVQSNSTATDEMVIVGSKSNRPAKSGNLSDSSPRTYILSFDNSTMIPATPEPFSAFQRGGTRSSKSTSTMSSKKRTLDNQNPKASQGVKRGRTGSQTVDHIMAERKRRQELTERFIALSATIPGLKKTDKSSILHEAINYVKQLQERVRELEQRNKRCKESVIILKKSDLCANEDSIWTETNSDDWCIHRPNEMLPNVEARVMDNEVLIEIHCEKEDGVDLKILDQIENLHLSVTASSVLPFGNSTLGITIIAQMGDTYRMTVNDLVKNLRQALLNHMNINADPY